MPRKKKSEKEESSQKIIINSEVQPNQDIVQNPVQQELKKKSYIGWLIFLIIILIALDLISLYVFYKPDLSGFTDFFKFKNPKVIETLKCTDGTSYDSCSKDKPYYCYNGELLKNANICGCPNGYEIDFQTCKKINSS